MPQVLIICTPGEREGGIRASGKGGESALLGENKIFINTTGNINSLLGGGGWGGGGGKKKKKRKKKNLFGGGKCPRVRKKRTVTTRVVK